MNRTVTIILAVIAFGVMVSVIFFLPVDVYAQSGTETPQPTLTPTPQYEYQVPLSSGTLAVVERRLTYGDIAICVLLGVIIVLLSIYFVIRVPKLWLQ